MQTEGEEEDEDDDGTESFEEDEEEDEEEEEGENDGAGSGAGRKTGSSGIGHTTALGVLVQAIDAVERSICAQESTANIDKVLDELVRNMKEKKQVYDSLLGDVSGGKDLDEAIFRTARTGQEFTYRDILNRTRESTAVLLELYRRGEGIRDQILTNVVGKNVESDTATLDTTRDTDDMDTDTVTETETGTEASSSSDDDDADDAAQENGGIDEQDDLIDFDSEHLRCLRVARTYIFGLDTAMCDRFAICMGLMRDFVCSSDFNASYLVTVLSELIKANKEDKLDVLAMMRGSRLERGGASVRGRRRIAPSGATSSSAGEGVTEDDADTEMIVLRKSVMHRSPLPNRHPPMDHAAVGEADEIGHDLSESASDSSVETPMVTPSVQTPEKSGRKPTGSEKSRRSRRGRVFDAASGTYMTAHEAREQQFLQDVIVQGDVKQKSKKKKRGGGVGTASGAGTTKFTEDGLPIPADVLSADEREQARVDSYHALLVSSSAGGGTSDSDSSCVYAYENEHAKTVIEFGDDVQHSSKKRRTTITRS